VWLPIVTPFVDGEVDYAGYERLVEHYVAAGVNGIIPLGTTGESPTIDEAEADTLIERTVEAVDGRVPIVVGVSGNDTRKVVKTIERLQRHRVDGLLATCPYYNRPSQDGLRAHFTHLAEATDRPILIYNIPYRTGAISRTTPCSRWPSCPTSPASRTPRATWPSRWPCCDAGPKASRC
jgi:4-hydroxy-tetrahydrodipicolinate synthase